MSLEIVLGPMFSGKSTYALSYIRRQRAIGKLVKVIKPNIDNRYGNEELIVTHNRESIPCELWPVQKPLCEMTDLWRYDCFVIEEAQFLKELHHFCSHVLLELKKDILVVGLDGDAKQAKFGEIMDVIPLATSVTKLSALCHVCRNGTPAYYTKRYNGEQNAQVDVGGDEKYIAVCLNHL